MPASPTYVSSESKSRRYSEIAVCMFEMASVRRPSDAHSSMSISALICFAASQIVSRSRCDGPRVAVTMQ